MSQERLNHLLDAIEELDAELVRLMEERRALVIEVGGIKRELGLPVMDPTREAAVVRRAATLARDRGRDEEMVRDVIWRIIASARDETGGSGWLGTDSKPRVGQVGRLSQRAGLNYSGGYTEMALRPRKVSKRTTPSATAKRV